MTTITISSVIVCYSFYLTSNAENPNMIFTTIFVVYGIYIYNYIINTTEEGNLTDVVLSDRCLLLNVLLWICRCYH